MLNSIWRVFVRRNASDIRVPFSSYDKLLFSLQFNPFCSSSTATSRPSSRNGKRYTFTVNYLINTCGFSPERAVTASNHLNIVSATKPDIVIEFLKNQGFTIEQIISLIKIYPRFLVSHPQKTLLPKIDFVRSLGFSETEVTSIFLAEPSLFRRSLEKQIMPNYSYVKSLFESTGHSILTTKYLPRIFICDLQSKLLPNVEVLRNAGVPDKKIVVLLQYQPRVFMVDPARFKEIVEKVKKMGFNPLALSFVLAVQAFRSMTKLTWEKKLATYKKWGLSENEIVSAFVKHPRLMTISVDKIMAVMDFLVGKMGLNSSHVLQTPKVVSFSLEKRIKPRCSVYEILLENSLIEKGYFGPLIEYSEERFIMRVALRYEKFVPGLLKLYQKELVNSKHC